LTLQIFRRDSSTNIVSLIQVSTTHHYPK
jgi:hypothetical protein